MRRVTVRDVVRNSKILGYGQELEVTNNGETIGWFTPKYPGLKKVIELHGGELNIPTPPAKTGVYENNPPAHLICETHGVYLATCGCGGGDNND